MASVSVPKVCPFDNKVSVLILDADAVDAYNAGAFVQDAFPNLSAEIRETIKTGICSACQDDIFSEDEED